MFLVCLDTASAQQLDEGIVSVLLPNAKVEPFEQGTYAYHQLCFFNVEHLRGKQSQNKTKQIPWSKMLFVYTY